MDCSCGGDTAVTETRTLEGVLRRRRKCKSCGQAFYTQEVFLYNAEDAPRNVAIKKKQYFTKPEAAEIQRKKVETRRKVEDIKEEKRERKLRVPNYFIEEEDY